MSPQPQDIGGQNLFVEFTDGVDDPTQILTVNELHCAVLTDYYTRLKVQEQINLPANMARRDQDMVEVQNRLGPRDPDEATCSIAGELLAMRTVIRHMTDVMLDGEQLAFIKVLYNNYKIQLSTFNDFVVNTVQTMVKQIILFITPLQVFYQKYTVSPRGGVIPSPVDFLDTWLQALEAGLLRVEHRGASLAHPSSNTTMSMNNFATAAMGKLFSLAPPVEFSNPGGTVNLSATTASVSMDEFNQLLA